MGFVFPPLLGVFGDETVFADGKVNHIGQVIGVIVAESQPLAQRAAKAVRVTYEDLPSVITIEVGRVSLLQCYKLVLLDTNLCRMQSKPTHFIPLSIR